MSFLNDYYLKDVFEGALDLLKASKSPHDPRELSDAIAKADQRVRRTEDAIMRAKLERHHSDIFTKVQQWDQARAEGRRLIATSDPAWKAPAPEEPKLAFTVDSRGTVQMHVGSEMIGLVSSLHLKASADQVRPEITVSFLQGLTLKDVGKLSVEAQEHLNKSAKLLCKFPFVQVEIPTDRNS